MQLKPLNRGFAITGFLALFLAACSGGGGGGGGATSIPASSTLGGVAAVGAPIVNGSISARCAAGSSLSTTTNSTGIWQVTLSATHVLPCAVQVSGGTINNLANTTTYHSIANAAGVVNVTPLTDLMVANLGGTATPDIWFMGLSTSPAPLTSITQAKVDATLTLLRIALSGLAPLSNINPITTTFTPAAGNVSDDMLTALQTAMTNAGVTYFALLGNASTTTFVAPATGFNNVLTTAYTNTTSGSVPKFDVASLTFAPQDNFTTSAPQTVVLSNAGNKDIAIADYAIKSPLFAQWSVINTTCPIAPTVFSAGASCTFSIVFKPSGDQNILNVYVLNKSLGLNPALPGPENYSGVLEVNSTSLTNPKVAVLLNGTGVYPPEAGVGTVKAKTIADFAGIYNLNTANGIAATISVDTAGNVSSCRIGTVVSCSGKLILNLATNVASFPISGNDGLNPIDTTATLSGTVDATGKASGSYSSNSVADGAFSGTFTGSLTVPQATVVPTVTGTSPSAGPVGSSTLTREQSTDAGDYPKINFIAQCFVAVGQPASKTNTSANGGPCKEQFKRVELGATCGSGSSYTPTILISNELNLAICLAENSTGFYKDRYINQAADLTASLKNAPKTCPVGYSSNDMGLCTPTSSSTTGGTGSRADELWHDNYSNKVTSTGLVTAYPNHENNIPGDVIASKLSSQSTAQAVWASQGGVVTSFTGCNSCGVGSTIRVVVDFGYVIDTHIYVRDK